MGNYEQVTRGIRVSVSPHYLEDQSDPDEPRHVWAYTVRIDNESEDVVQLRTRHWRITDALGYTDVVNGDGVVSVLVLNGDGVRPGEHFADCDLFDFVPTLLTLTGLDLAADLPGDIIAGALEPDLAARIPGMVATYDTPVVNPAN